MPRLALASYPKEFLSLILEKEARGEVCFLKPPHTSYAGDYAAVSARLAHTTQDVLVQEVLVFASRCS